ncbi:hypothetical protein [Leptolyngbya iicbica]|uniref:Uncharacterized protein n=2 Tax=Cyanophyceae TaxID=3028117 RepID=A0A4Q7E6J4_9CYAN|nr:hypothetical protein [Leptolyngbya sp. LK]RZM78750.1 hypothetical protein DYY88_08100 [Leptolyngbya sp. LK]
MVLRYFAASIVGLSLAAVSLPAEARPEIASGDQWLEGVDQEQCLSRADDFIRELNVPNEAGDIDRTGYFDDGVFRILCYTGGEDSSMLLVFSAHNDSIEVATQFLQFALEELAVAADTDEEAGLL